MHSFTQALHCVRTNESLPKTNFVNSVDSTDFYRLSTYVFFFIFIFLRLIICLSTKKHEEIGGNLQNLTNINLFWSS